MSNDKITAAVREPYDSMGPIDTPNPPAARSTLADVQPGGRVRLGDEAERARFEAWVKNHVSSLARAADGEYASNFTHALWSAWQAALSAQPSPATCKEGLQVHPSPGGQGDARAQFEAWAESAGWYAVAYRPDRDAPYALNAVEFAWQAFQAALAARQPVGEPVCSGGFVISNGSGEKYMAWGQVGPEWTADRSAALWLVRRADAEALAAENEDAWSILPVERCPLPPSGWACTLAAGHEGPCPTIAAPPAQAVDLGPTFQNGVADLMGQCFLPSLYSNMTERGDRLLEEVLELLQAHGYDKARVPTLVDYVFGRPVGEPAQEVGGVMVTLAGYCWVAGLDMHAAGDAELARINQPDVMAKIRAKQEAKNALHFDTPLPGDPTATDAWPREGDLVRYGDGASELAIRLQPHAGGWHGYQCCGGYTFFTKAYRPSRADMDTWLDCAKYRDGHTKVADNRVAHEMYLLDSQAVGK